MSPDPNDRAAAAGRPAAGSAEPRLRAPARPAQRVLSETLFGSAVELEIDHRGTLYRLRQTSLGKLILTK